MQMREERELFRQKLVELIAAPDDPEMSLDDLGNNLAGEFPNNKEKEILRYYYYIKHGIETIHVSPINKRVLTR